MVFLKLAALSVVVLLSITHGIAGGVFSIFSEESSLENSFPRRVSQDPWVRDLIGDTAVSEIQERMIHDACLPIQWDILGQDFIKYDGTATVVTEDQHARMNQRREAAILLSKRCCLSPIEPQGNSLTLEDVAERQRLLRAVCQLHLTPEEMQQLGLKISALALALSKDLKPETRVALLKTLTELDPSDHDWFKEGTLSLLTLPMKGERSEDIVYALRKRLLPADKGFFMGLVKHVKESGQTSSPSLSSKKEEKPLSIAHVVRIINEYQG